MSESGETSLLMRSEGCQSQLSFLLCYYVTLMQYLNYKKTSSGEISVANKTYLKLNVIHIHPLFITKILIKTPACALITVTGKPLKH
jgi:hypothetical protein